MYNGLLSSSNGLLINNFSIQRINKQVVITNVRLCMIVLSHISSNIWTQSMLISHPKAQLSIFCEQLCNCTQDCASMDPFNVKGWYLVKNGLLINSFSPNDVYIRHLCDTSVCPTTYIYVRSSARVFSSQKCARKIGVYEKFFCVILIFLWW